MRPPETELQTDVLVIGGGAAGCLAAMAAREHGAKVTLVEKAGSITRSGSCASGMDHIVAILNQEPWDTPEDYLGSLAASRPGLIDTRVVEVYARENKRVFDYMEQFGTPFRDAKTGKYTRIAGMGGQKARTVSFKGARIKPIMAAQVRKLGVQVVERVALQGLLTGGGRVMGATGFHIRNGGFHILKAKSVVIATGGVLRLYASPCHQVYLTANGPPYNTGEGHIMAFEAGASLANMEFTTTSIVPAGFSAAGATGFLSMGAHLINARGERYMFKYHPWGEHAPRNIASLAMHREYAEGRGPCFMDCRHLSKEAIDFVKRGILHEKATLLDYFDARGIDMARDPIPYELREISIQGSGIAINEKCEATVEGLFAAGDCTSINLAFSGACTLGFVAGLRAAEKASVFKGSVEIDRRQVDEIRDMSYAPLTSPDASGLSYADLENDLRQTMSTYVGFDREAEGLQKALSRLQTLKESTSGLTVTNYHDLMRANETRNLIDTALLIATATLERKESRAGLSHCRSDYPEKDDENWRRFIVLSKGDNGQVRVSSEPVPGR
ncbi:MAG: FAD-dependent oxidoreductase [Dehalococcoidia bacterium]|nr:FAD-dependent oxidoreductase [Dehalococcoidia bacterium]